MFNWDGLECKSNTSKLRPDENTAYWLRPKGGYNRIWSSTSCSNNVGSIISCNRREAVVNVDVQHFDPKDISVGVKKNEVKIELKHDEKDDEYGGTVSRHFIRKYTLTSGAYKMDSLKCALSSDGVLTITVPSTAEKDEDYRSIPINQTGVRSAPIIFNNKNEKEIDHKPEDPKPEELEVPEEPPQEEEA